MNRNRLKVLRAERNVSQVDTAQKAGLEPNRYWRIEKGYRQPTSEELASIAAALGVAPTELGFPMAMEQSA